MAQSKGPERPRSRLMSSQPPAMELLVGPEAYGDTIRRVAPAWALVAMTGSLVALLLGSSSTPGFHRTEAVIVVAGTMVGWAIPGFLWLGLRRPARIDIWAGVFACVSAVLASVVFSTAGPLHQETAVFVPSIAAAAFLFTSRPVAIVTATVAFGGYAVVVLTGTGYSDPATRILVVLSFMVPTAALMDWTVRNLERLSAQERAAARQVADLAEQLKDVNRDLEERVSEQVSEIETLGRLRRFLSPQIADAVVAAGNDELLKPHRRRVSVLFCDLRGFTLFVGTAEPEEVVEALDEYFNAVGTVLRKHNATIGVFAGDGIMAYLNDPVPCDDPAGTAVTMALELRRALSPQTETWSARGHDLGFGIGVAFGYATLATIGFEGRYDYTPLGSVVNLASRLCAEAATGEVLIDARTAETVRQRFDVEARQVNLKGFPEPVRAFRLSGES